MKTINLNGNGAETPTRAAMRTSNILDMNIVPINVHAFMREVPFVNLLNYSYTFDRMAHEFINPEYYSSAINTMIMPANAPISSTRELLVKLLVHPYADLGTDGKQYYALLASLFNGNDNMRLGIAKYLSDQLWHKVLLTSSAQLASESDDQTFPGMEAGPAAYEATNAIIHYGTKFNASHVQDANFMQGFKRYVKPDKILTECESKNVGDAQSANGLNNGGAPSVGTALVNGSLTQLAAANTVDGAAAANLSGQTAVALPHLITQYNNPAHWDAAIDAVLPQDIIAWGLEIPGTFTALSTSAVYIELNRTYLNSQLTRFQENLKTAVFKPRVGDPFGGGIAFQADTAIQLVESKEFKDFVARAGVISTAAVVSATRAPLDTEAKTVTALINGGLLPSVPRTLSKKLAAGDVLATVTAAIANQANDVVYHCLHGHGTTQAAADELYRQIRSRQMSSGIDITTCDAIPNSLRGGGPNLSNPTGSGTIGGVGFVADVQLVYKNTASAIADDGLPAGINANLPGVNVILIMFDEFLRLMRPFRQYKELRGFAKRLFMMHFYRLNKHADLQGALRVESARVSGLANLPRWVKFVVNYMTERMCVGLVGANGNAATHFTFDNSDPGALQAPFNAAIPGLGFGNTTAPVRDLSAQAARSDQPQFLARMKELIALSYCNPFLIIEEIIPRCAPGISANVYMEIASLPNMTPGLKIRDKHHKKWDHAAKKTPMNSAEVIYCAEIGRARFDTKIVRNLTWFVQLQRVMRVVLTNHLSWINSPVVRGLKIADLNMTELKGNAGYKTQDFTGESYSGKI
jgi:hypothetical protein